MSVTTDQLVIAVTGGAGSELGLHQAAAAVRAGGLGVLDLGVGDAWRLRELELAARGTSLLGVRVTADCAASPSDVAPFASVETIVLTADAPWSVAALVGRYQVLVEVIDVAEARAAAEAGAHGLIARGMESGGRVSELSSFVLLQQLVDAVQLPVWVAGGIGPRTAVAAVIGGAAGVVLDSQLLLLPDSAVADATAAVVRRMDGSESVLDGGRRGLTVDGMVVPIGPDGWLAGLFARRFSNTAAAVRGIATLVADGLADREAGTVLQRNAPLARSLGVELPVAQGPMTRVSDVAGFAADVADAGGLPFLALALANAEQSRRMLTEAAAALGERPWGVGVLGFAPEHVRAAQLDAIRQIKPSVAIIAGGRPAQARALEADGIATFLHVPSPGLLKQFLQAGSRRFVFEGAECGGHVGPRASFSLWEAQLDVIADFLADRDVAADLQIFFAGGIHDERSAAMVAAMAGPLTHRGVRVGVLMGTAYLFTAEAVKRGAIQPAFQRHALAATRTALLETAPGHATRCLPSAFVDEFHTLRDDLARAGVANRDVWEKLETLNVGRLRIASKGRRRNGDVLVEVDEAGQAADGLFMAGQVAVLRSATTTIADLHIQVSSGAADFHAARTAPAAERAAAAPTAAPLDIAVIGMACVFAGSPDLPSFWNTVVAGADRVTEVPVGRWDVDTYYAPEVGPGQAGRVSVSKWGGFIDAVPFDAIRYGIPPAALASIDPTQLLALEISHRALVDAGYPYDAADADHSRTGVVFGAEEGSDLSHAINLRTLLPAYFGEVPEPLQAQLPLVTEDTFPGVLANVIAGRVANRLDLGGPNMVIDAACASSLAALDAACKELTLGASDLMICGGADLHNGINDYLMFTAAQALSPTGRCRTFDSTGDGIALGEGVASVVLKRLADAERDGDRVYAVIKGVGGASDGRALGLTAPRSEGQRRALDRAYASAGLSPRDVGLVEAHGTGTVVGDRTELQTLTRLFTESGARPGSTALGSVKSQIGHTKCAAGLAGVIKAALAVYTGVKPPTINLAQPNPAWDLASSPFVFNTQARPWAAPAAERLAAVSAFGFGGTNFHVVLGAHPATADPQHARDMWPTELFCFRGADREAARRSVRGLLERLPAPGTGVSSLRDLAAVHARESDPRTGAVRIAVVAENLDDLVSLLLRAEAGEHEPARGLIQPTEAPVGGLGKVAFLFPGQGSQQTGAMAELFVAFPELRHYLELGPEWADALFPPAAFDEATAQVQRDRIRDTRVAQPVLGIGGLAADHLLRRLGVRPDMTGGHSYGELVALCSAGAFDPATLLELSRERANAILAAAGDDPGTMAAVGATAERADAVLRGTGLDAVVIANHNGPRQVVISGPTQAVAQAVAAFQNAGLQARKIPVACAFHSPVVAAGGAAFGSVLAGRAVSAPLLPVWSNRSAEPYDADPDAVRAGLAAQIGAPVRFLAQIESMYAAGARVFVEAGPGQVLSKLVRAVLGERPHLVVGVDGARPGSGLRTLLTTVGELACAGVPVQLGWLFQGRVGGKPEATSVKRPVWTVDGQLVRDSFGQTLPGGMTPARRIETKEWTTVTTPNGSNVGHDNRAELVGEFLRTSRELIAGQRDVLLAYLSDGATGRLRWEPEAAAPVPAAAVLPAMTAQPIAAEASAVLAPVATSAAAVTVAAPTPAVPAASSLDAPVVDVQAVVLGVLSDRTGYPTELIEPGLDLEADLSVDSIKRAEVAGEVAARLGLSMDGADADLEDLVKARTVRAMVSWLDDRIGLVTTATPVPSAEAAPVAALEAAPERVGLAPKRLVSAFTPAAVDGRAVAVSGARFRLIGEVPAGEALTALLVESGAAVVDGPAADGVVMLDGLAPGEPLLPDVFAQLQQIMADGPRWLIAAGPQGGSERTDGMPGLFRTLAREYPAVVVRWVEVPPDALAADVARWLYEELAEPAPAAVVRRHADGRDVESLIPTELGALAAGGAGPAGEGVAEAKAVGLDADSVVVLVGGARGITAWFARALANAVRCRIELVGRTPLPQTPQDAKLAAARDRTALRAEFAQRGMRSPAEIERAAQAVLSAREVAATIAELTELGAQVTYHAVDVRDADATGMLMKRIYDDHGRLDGVVYAAGVIEDKLFADKDPESFARVYGTKVDGARSVLDALAVCGAKPGFVVFFGSIAAAYGNRGQSDYAAANDALDTMATRWSQETGRRGLTVHWGPWAPVGAHGGMVTPELTAEYARRGIALIDPEEGALSLLRELAYGDATTTAVVLTASGW